MSLAFWRRKRPDAAPQEGPPAAGAKAVLGGPLPTKRSCLERLLRCGVEIDTVVDVGVFHGTKELMDAFPRVRHLLLEPLTSVTPQIECFYAHIPHELHNVACFDRDGEAWIIGRSIDGSGVETHSCVADAPVTPGTGDVVSCRSIRRARLDSLGLTLGERVLLKVDVDGVDLEVLRGAEGILGRVQVIIVEAPMTQLLDRANYLASRGFRLHDVIDLAYYHEALSQVDLVFVREELYARLPELYPWASKTFSYEAYRDLTKRLEPA
jgi:FkbM family methyltransferase